MSHPSSLLEPVGNEYGPRPQDRRVSVRLPSQARGLWWPVRFFTSGIWQGRVRDFSQHGLALSVQGPEEPGTFLVWRTSRPEDAGPRVFRLQVVHVSRQAPRSWVLGCRFVQPLGPADMELFAAWSDGDPVGDTASPTF